MSEWYKQGSKLRARSMQALGDLYGRVMDRSFDGDASISLEGESDGISKESGLESEGISKVISG